MSADRKAVTGLDVARTEQLLAEQRGENDAVMVPKAEYERMRADISDLRSLIERICNAYGALPTWKKAATGSVNLAVNSWINYRDKIDSARRAKERT